MVAVSPGGTIFTQISDFILFRSKRLYNTFYNGHYSSKFALVFLFPGLLCAVRYRAETRFGYHVFIADQSIEPIPQAPKWLIGAKTLGLEKFFKWKNGQKYYCQPNITVSQFKTLIFNGMSNVPVDAVVGCKGRMFEDSDNLAMAVRSFCKRDPRIVVWREDWQQNLIN